MSSAASDGRQTITPGEFGVLEYTIVESGVLGLDIEQDEVCGLAIGGDVYKARLIATSGSHSLANGPTYTELLTACPMFNFVPSHL